MDLLPELAGGRQKLVPGWASNSALLSEKQTHRGAEGGGRNPNYFNFAITLHGAELSGRPCRGVGAVGGDRDNQ